MNTTGMNLNLDNLKETENVCTFNVPYSTFIFIVFILQKIVRMLLAASTSFDCLSKSEEGQFVQSSTEYLTLLRV